MPTWYLDNRPMDPHHIFAAATATAPKLQVASSQAANKARGDIASRIETKFEGLTKQFQEEVGDGPNSRSVSQFTQAYKSVVSRTIRGSEVVKREIKREGDGYRAYVLMRLPIGQAQEKLLQQIQTQQNAYTRFRSSQAFKELEQEVDGYRQRQKEQQAREQGRRTTQRDPQTGPSTQQDQQQSQTGDPSSDAQVQKQQAEAGETLDAGDAPSEDEVRAPAQDSDQQGTSKVERIEAQVRSAAEPWMGVSYKFGGESKNGVDCSALVQALYDEAFNIDLPRTTGKQVNQGRKVARSNLKAGDLVFFRNEENGKHVGIYLDDRKFVHASSSQGVTISPMKYDYWQENYWQTRRLSSVL
jgi:cell wall-associated NlpC family hydrolase